MPHGFLGTFYRVAGTPVNDAAGTGSFTRI